MKGLGKLLACIAMGVMLALPAWSIPIPETQRVTVNGVTWAQPNLFGGTWGEFNAQCPDGPCASGSLLESWDMTGWTWGGPEDVAALLNYYLANAGVAGSDLLDPANLNDSFVTVQAAPAPWITAIAKDFRRTGYDHTAGYYLWGWVAQIPGQRYMVYAQSAPEFWQSTARSSSAASGNPDRTETGAWFFCTDACPPTESVAAPGVLQLVALALAALGWSRSRHARLLSGSPC